jgi:murein L,D-transpeptidase YafK
MKLNVLLSVIVLLLLTACGEPTTYGKITHGSYETKECIKSLSIGSEIISSEIVDKIVVYKKERKLYTYRNGKRMGEYHISLGAHGGANAGNKVKAGDYRTPEGDYTIVRKKCDGRLYRSLMISYPNQKDKERAASQGVKPGGYITIHGQPKWNADGHGDAYTLAHDWTEGCMAVPNKTMAQLWKVVQNGASITINP